MIRSDSTNVKLPLSNSKNNSDDYAKLKEYKEWFLKNNIKYEFIYTQQWDIRPTYVRLRNEDALFFKLTFGFV